MTTATHTIPGNPDMWWEAGALKAVKALASTGRSFTAADLTDMGVADPDHPNRWGSLFAKAKTLGLIRKVGYEPSRRPGRDKGVCAVWVGASA